MAGSPEAAAGLRAAGSGWGRIDDWLMWKKPCCPVWSSHFTGEETARTGKGGHMGTLREHHVLDFPPPPPPPQGFFYNIRGSQMVHPRHIHHMGPL